MISISSKNEIVEKKMCVSEMQIKKMEKFH